jgi:hypothetical protein
MTHKLQEELQKNTGLKLKVTINDNRSTMMSVRWKHDYTIVSLHRMFLKAPENVMEGLACYLKEKKKVVPATIRAFIESNVKRLDYSHLVDKKKLCVLGTTYNLQEIYDSLNKEYFENQLNLSLTWYGREQKKRARKYLALGLYHESTKLVKIHRMLDSPSVPFYVVSYVMYHEMLHAVCPSYFDKRGIHKIHTKEFKKREEQFPQFNEALEWIRNNHHLLF